MHLANGCDKFWGEKLLEPANDYFARCFYFIATNYDDLLSWFGVFYIAGPFKVVQSSFQNSQILKVAAHWTLCPIIFSHPRLTCKVRTSNDSKDYQSRHIEQTFSLINKSKSFIIHHKSCFDNLVDRSSRC